MENHTGTTQTSMISSVETFIEEIDHTDGARKLISDEIANLSLQIVYFTMIPINLSGVITNAINMRVFAKQGWTESTNVTLFTLALTEMSGCLFILPMSLCWIVNKFGSPANFWECLTFAQMPFAYPHIMCTRTVSWITVYLSVERALCVVIPLKVKSVINPQRTMLTMATLWVFFIAFHIPFATTTEIAWRFNTYLNTTVAATIQKENNNQFQIITLLIGTTILSTAAIIIVFFTTIVMVYKLNDSRKWRQSFSTRGARVVSSTEEKTSGKPRTSSKELETLKTVTMVTSIYLVSVALGYVPSSVSIALPGVTISGVNYNVFHVVNSSKFFFTAINATASFFGYIRISSKYQTTFYELCPVCSKTPVTK